MWQTLRQSPPQLRWLLCASFFFNLAFYMLIPYLAWHLRENLLLSAGTIGLLLGARHLSQQGMFVLGGLLADRWGNKFLLLLGCWLRAISLILLALSEHLFPVALAILLIGFSAALFTPAAQALFAKQDNGQSTFALVSVSRSAGELGGPLLGMLLIQLNFTYLCVSAAIPFVIFGIVFSALSAEEQKTEHNELRLGNGIRNVFQKREFILFCVTMSGYFILINQLSFILPLALQQRGGGAAWIGALFFASAAMGITLQFWLSRWCESRWQPSRILECGFVIMSCAFLLPMIDLPNTQWLDLTLILGTGLMLTLGMLMCYPVIMHQISLFSEQKETATHYGVFYFFAGIGTALGNAALGWLFDADSGESVHFSAWFFLTALALGAALGVRFRARHYDPPLTEISHA